MKFLHGFQPFPDLVRGSVATIGHFDGVHRGHQALLTRLRDEALRLGLPTLVILFEPHAGEFFLKDKAPARLSLLREKIDCLRTVGVDYVYCFHFNSMLAQLSPHAFAERFLFSLLNVKHLLLGDDFRFGRDRAGDVSLLASMGATFGCHVTRYPSFLSGKTRISSTRIRAALQRGDLACVAQCLGRPYCLSGRVVRGDGLGRQWGIPTANLAVRRTTLPLTGVYCVKVKHPQGIWLTGVANLGVRPTVKGMAPRVEVHVLDFDGSLYGERLTMIFLQKLRDEASFSSVDLLVKQIHNDIAQARAYFTKDVV